MILLFPLAVQSGKRAGLGVNLHYIRRIAHIHSEESVSLLGVKVPRSSNHPYVRKASADKPRIPNSKEGSYTDMGWTRDLRWLPSRLPVHHKPADLAT